MFYTGKSYCSSFDTDCSIHATMCLTINQPTQPNRKFILFIYSVCCIVLCAYACALAAVVSLELCINPEKQTQNNIQHHKSLNWLCLFTLIFVFRMRVRVRVREFHFRCAGYISLPFFQMPPPLFPMPCLSMYVVTVITLWYNRWSENVTVLLKYTGALSLSHAKAEPRHFKWKIINDFWWLSGSNWKRRHHRKNRHRHRPLRRRALWK